MITLVLIAIIIILLYKLTETNRLIEGMDNLSASNIEAIQNVASIYNNGTLTVTNLKVTGDASIQNIKSPKATISYISSPRISTGQLNCPKATITDLKATKTTVGSLRATTSYASSLTAPTLNASKLVPIKAYNEIPQEPEAVIYLVKHTTHDAALVPGKHNFGRIGIKGRAFDDGYITEMFTGRSAD